MGEGEMSHCAPSVKALHLSSFEGVWWNPEPIGKSLYTGMYLKLTRVSYPLSKWAGIWRARSLKSMKFCIFASWLLFFFFFGSTGFSTQGLALLHRCSTTWAIPPSLFCFSYFSMDFAFLARAVLDHDPITYASCLAVIYRYAPPHLACLLR
jgi:hypothetical protein